LTSAFLLVAVMMTDFLSEFWSDLFDNPLHSVYAAILCLAVVLAAGVVIVKFRPAEVRKLAWQVFLATAAFFALSFILWSLQTGLGPLDDWKSILIIPLLALIVHLFVVTVNGWCIAILLAWRYKNHYRHCWHVWTAWISTSSWILWSLFNGGL
jgi:hypothetical protein